jgi:hypothetical protein
VHVARKSGAGAGSVEWAGTVVGVLDLGLIDDHLRAKGGWGCIDISFGVCRGGRASVHNMRWADELEHG